MNDSERWICFLRFESGPPATVVMDLGARDGIALSEYPECLLAEIELGHVDQHGFPSGEELERHRDLEDTLIQRLAHAASARFAGTVTGQGRRVHCWYCADAAQAQAAAEETLQQFPEAKVHLRQEADPEWEHYRQMLPTAAEYRVYLDDRVLHQLREMGDSLQVPRNVDHWLYFPDQESREQFVQRVEQHGFQVKTQRDDAEHVLPFELVVHHTIPMEAATVHQATLRLLTLAEKHGGQYDGWETSIEKAEDQEA